MKLALALALILAGIIACSAQTNPPVEYYANKTCYHSSRSMLIISKLGSDPLQLNNITFPGTLIRDTVDLVCGQTPTTSFADEDDDDDDDDDDNNGAYNATQRREWFRKSFGLDDNNSGTIRSFLKKTKWERVAPHSIGGLGKYIKKKNFVLDPITPHSFLEMSNPPSNDTIPLEWYQNGGDLIRDGSERYDTLDARNLTANDVRQAVSFAVELIDSLLHHPCGNDGSCAAARTNAMYICRNHIRTHWGSSNYTVSFGSPDNQQKRLDFLNAIDSLWQYLGYLSPYAGRCD